MEVWFCCITKEYIGSVGAIRRFSGSGRIHANLPLSTELFAAAAIGEEHHGLAHIILIPWRYGDFRRVVGAHEAAAIRIADGQRIERCSPQRARPIRIHRDNHDFQRPDHLQEAAAAILWVDVQDEPICKAVRVLVDSVAQPADVDRREKRLCTREINERLIGRITRLGLTRHSADLLREFNDAAAGIGQFIFEPLNFFAQTIILGADAVAGAAGYCKHNRHKGGDDRDSSCPHLSGHACMLRDRRDCGDLPRRAPFGFRLPG